MNGEADINFNLQDRHLTSGTLVYIGPGTIIHPQRLSSDLRIFGMGLFSNFPMPFAQGQMPSVFNGQVRDFQLSANEEDIATATHIMDAIWQTVHATDDYHRPTVTALVAAQMHHYDQLAGQQSFTRTDHFRPFPPTGHPALCRASPNRLLCRPHVPH